VTITKILLVALVGVIEIDSPVTSTKLVEAVLKVSLLKTFFICTIADVGLVAAKLRLALSDAAVSTSPAV
jgi:hypothetical protein